MKTLFTAIFFTFLISSAFAQDIKKCDVTFRATGSPGFITIDGEAKSPCQGKLEYKGNMTSQKIVLDLRKLETGISLRDRHMKNKYLEVKKFPEAVLSNFSTDGQGKFKGTLELHGIKKEVTGDYTKSGNDFDANFKVKLSDFEIKIPSFMGVTVAEIVTIKVKLAL